MNSGNISISSGITGLISQNEFIQLNQELNKEQELEIKSARNNNNINKRQIGNKQRAKQLFNKFRKTKEAEIELTQEIKSQQSMVYSKKENKNYFDQYLKWKQNDIKHDNQIREYQNRLLQQNIFKSQKSQSNRSQKNIRQVIQSEINASAYQIFSQFRKKQQKQYQETEKSQKQNTIQQQGFEKYKSTLKQKIQNIQKINNQMQELEKTLETIKKQRETRIVQQKIQQSKYRQQLKSTIKSNSKINQSQISIKPETIIFQKKPIDLQLKNFQALIKHPPKKQSYRQIVQSEKLSKLSQSRQVKKQTKLDKQIRQMCVQTEFKVDSYVQTQKPKLILKKLDLQKIFELNDYHFLQFIDFNKQQIQKMGTRTQKNLLNHRIRKIRQKTNVKQLLEKVIKNSDAQILKKISSNHKQRAYEFLFK